MLARLNRLLGRDATWGPRRAFGCFHRSVRLIDTRRSTLAMYRSALRCLALELSIEHSAGENGCRPIATESQRQNPNQSPKHEGANQAHGIPRSMKPLA